jgi:membrane protease YdiL (CAAX protease family)
MKKTLKNFILFLLIFFVWMLFAPISVALPLVAINNFFDVSIEFQRFFLMISEVVTILFIFALYKDEIMSDIIKFKNNFISLIEKYIPYWIVMIVIMTVVSNIIGMFFKDGPANQNLVVESLKSTPLLVGISIVVLAPLVEELIFRFSLRKVFTNDYIYIFMSGLIFGLIHIISGENITKELPFLIIYCIPGFTFAYAYIKSKNIAVPIFLHFVHNVFATFVIFLAEVL